MISEQLLTDKVVLITGGAGLLGRVFASSVTAHGGMAVIADINLNAAKQAAERINQQAGTDKAYAIALDTNSRASLTGATHRLNEKFGKINALVNNAYPRNKNYGRHFFDVEYEDFCENLSINLGGYFLASQQLALYFKQQGFGHIINIASIYGVVPPRFEIYDNTSMTMPVEYAAIKSGLVQLTKYMAKYFQGMNIRVNSISPGGIFDHQPKLFLEAYKGFCANKGMLDKEDLAGTLVYLLSDLSQYVNGQNIIVDDGFSL